MRLSLSHKRVLQATFLLLWCSGLLWLLLHYFLRQQGDFGPVPHPLEKWSLRLHGLAVFMGLVLLGSLIPVHGRQAWRVRRQQRSGLAMTLTAVWLAGTGYALYYLVSDREASWIPVLHWGAGMAGPLLVLQHLRHRWVRRGARPGVSGVRA